MNHFLAKSVRHILNEHRDNFSSLTIVIPNIRAGVFLKNEIAKAIDHPIWLPQIITMSDWIQQLTDYTIVDESELLFELFDVHLKMEDEQMEFNEFQSWASQLIRDFNEIDMALADAKKLFDYINEIHAIENWNPSGKKLTETQQNYLTFWKSLGDLYVRFNKHLDQQQLAYSGKAYKDVALRVDDLFSHSKEKSFVFIGLNALTKAEEKIVYHLLKLNVAEALWDADSYYMQNDLHEAGYFLRRHQKMFPKTFQHVSDRLSHQSKDIFLAGLSGTMAQARFAGQHLKKLLKDSKPENIAIVLPDESLLFPLLESLPEEVNSLNVTMGYPIKSLRLFGFLKSIIDLFSSFDEKTWSSSLLEDVISFNYFSIIDSTLDTNNVTSVRKYLKKNNAPWVNLNSIKAILNDNGPLSSLIQINNSKELINYLLSTLQQLKDYFETKEGFDASIEQESIFLFLKLTRRLKKLADDSDKLEGFQNVLSVFKILVDSEKINFKGEPLEGVQIMGMLETRLLEFEHVIMLAMNEGIFPSKTKQNSFIPYDVRKSFGLNTQIENDAIYAYHFYRLLHGANEATFLYNTSTDQFNSDEKSRYLLQLQYELSKDNPNITITNEMVAAPFHSNPRQHVQVIRNNALNDRLLDKLTAGISPSSLNRFLNCPLDFYYRYVVGLKDRLEEADFLDASEIGNAIHLALYRFYELWIGEYLNIDKMKIRTSEVSTLVEQVFAETYSKKSIQTGKLLIAVKMVKETILHFVKTDIQRISKLGQVKLLALEEKLERKIDFETERHQHQVNIHGIIDRIEQHNESIYIFDYKSGNVLPSELKIADFSSFDGLDKKGKVIQLIVYAWLVNQAYQGTIKTGIIPLKTNKVQVMMASIQGNETISDEWEAVDNFLKELLNKITSVEAFQHETKSQYCTFCQ